MIRQKSEEDIERMYEEINKKFLPFDVIDRETVNDCVHKMCEISDYYFNTFMYDVGKARQIYENNLLCYRIRNNEKMNEPATVNTVLTILSGVNFFVKEYRNNPKSIFTDSVFYNSVGICSVFQNWRIKKVSKSLERYYKAMKIPDGQPFQPKYWFFNDGTLTDTINEFLSLKF